MENKNSNIDPFYVHLKDKLNEFNNQAPVELWNNIDLNLEKEDSLIDQKIKDHFLNSDKKAPEYIWYGIEQQLNIDRIWKKISPTLDRLKLVYIWRNRIKKWSAAALLLLLIRSCGMDLWVVDQVMPFSENQSASISSYNTKEIQQIAKQKIDEKKFDLVEIINSKNNFLNTEKRDIVKSPFNLEEFENTANYSGLVDDTSKVNHDLHEDFAKEVKNLTSIVPVVQFVDRDILNLKPISFNGFVQQSKIFETELIKNQLKNRNFYFKPKFDFGIVSTIQQIFLKNDLNAKILSNYVPSSSSSTIGYAYGIILGVNFNPRHAFVSEILINSRMRQDYVYQHNGKTNRETVDFDYFKVNMLYELNMLRFGTSKRNALNISSGIYLSHLKNKNANSPLASLSSNSSLSILAPKLNNWDWGFLANIGLEHALQKNLLFEYGIRSDIGIGSVYSSNNINYSNNGISNFIGFGFYSTIKYRF